MHHNTQPYIVGQHDTVVNIPIDDDDILKVTPIGSGNEVGRSAILVEFKGKTVMFDCGIHPAYSGLASLPFFDEIDPSAVDLVLVSHFHLDHCGAVPYFLEHTTFQGRMFMTHPTKAIYKLLLSDFVRVSDTASEEMLFSDQDLNKSLEKIELIDYHQELEHKGIRFWCYNAGHVLGAAMFMIEIAGIRVLYTGDFSRQSDRHLKGAETPTLSPHVLIVESTYGIQVHEPRREREARFTSMVHDIVRRGGRCLLPVFALGRAQELLLILEEYWEQHYHELNKIPIYYASSLAKKSMSIFQVTYINMMNEKIREKFEVSNPFYFKHISNLKSIEEFHDTGPCVVMAAPGMLQSGLSRQLFEMWCSDPRNGVVISGYSVEGTMAKKIMTEPPTVQLLNGAEVPLRMSVRAISFSAHSDREQTEEFISSINPPHIVLVHGDPNNMAKLKTALLHKFNGDDDETNLSNKRMRVYTPKNTESVKIVFKGEKTAKVIGSLAQQTPSQGASVSGVLLHKDFQHSLVAAVDLKTIADIPTAGVRQQLTVPLPLSRAIKRMSARDQSLEQYYFKKLKSLYDNVVVVQSQKSGDSDGDVSMGDHDESGDDKDNTSRTSKFALSKEEQGMIIYEIEGNIRMKLDPKAPGEAILEWQSSVTSDMIVDSLCFVFVDATSDSDSESDMDDEIIQEETAIMYTVQQILLDYFPDVSIDIQKKQFVVRDVKPLEQQQQEAASDEAMRDDEEEDDETERPIIIDQFGKVLQCDDPSLKSRLEIVLKRVYLSLFPMPSLMGCLDDHCHHVDIDHQH